MKLETTSLIQAMIGISNAESLLIEVKNSTKVSGKSKKALSDWIKGLARIKREFIISAQPSDTEILRENITNDEVSGQIYNINGMLMEMNKEDRDIIENAIEDLYDQMKEKSKEFICGNQDLGGGGGRCKFQCKECKHRGNQ